LLCDIDAENKVGRWMCLRCSLFVVCFTQMAWNTRVRSPWRYLIKASVCVGR